MRCKKCQYFDRVSGTPEDLVVRIKRRVSFSEVDIMGIVWFGRYSVYFEEGSAALGRICGLSYEDFYKAELRVPVVQLHIDYSQPLYLDEEFIIEARMVWDEAAKIITEYKLIKQDNTIAATGYMVQLLIDVKTNQTCLIAPKLLEGVRQRWKEGGLSVKFKPGDC